MPNLSTYLAFPGTAKEAFTHYQEVFGGELQLLTYGDLPPMGGPFTPEPDAVAHARLDFEGGSITGGDELPGKDLPIRDTAYSLLYTHEDVEAAKVLIQRLVDGGGSINMPFEPAPWGGTYGQVFDRFGVMWSFDVA